VNKKGIGYAQSFSRKPTAFSIIFLLRVATAAGLRIGEVLGIEIDKHISPGFLTLSINQKVRHGKVERRLKTANGFRQVDPHPTIASLLKQFVGNRKAGFLILHPKGKTRLAHEYNPPPSA
jgi:hypothetical protein